MGGQLEHYEPLRVMLQLPSELRKLRVDIEGLTEVRRPGRGRSVVGVIPSTDSGSKMVPVSV